MLSKDILQDLNRIDPVDAWRTLKGAGVKFVRFIIVDIFGRPKCEIVDINSARDIFERGLPFDGSSIPAYATVNKSDTVAYVDLGSIYIETWNGGKIASVFTNVVDDSGNPHPLDPRNVLLQVLYDMRRRGYGMRAGIEVEFFLVGDVGGKPQLADSGVYFEGYDTQMLLKTILEIQTHFELAGLGTSKIHHEVAPSQYELNLPADNPVRTADKLLIFKMMTKDIAKEHGLLATFMPKPFWGINGSGAHTHLSLYDYKAERNLFESAEKITETCAYAIGGILRYAREISAVVSPTVNSYKRLVPGYEAPTRIVWGYANRSALVRVPFYKRKINRIEYRQPDPSMNPYLALAVMGIAMMKGVENKIDPGQPTEEVAYELKGVLETPRHLQEAIDLFEKSEIAEALPSELVRKYVELKRKEWESYCSHVNKPWEETVSVITDWEYGQYLYTA